MRKSDYFFITTAALMAVFAVLVIVDHTKDGDAEKRVAQEKRLVNMYGLTDICLFTEARYTRHLSQADLFTPFQDFPVSLEHFPSGSVVGPPAHLFNRNRME